MKICPKCKKEYPDEDSFCDECGGKLKEKEEKKRVEAHGRKEHIIEIKGISKKKILYVIITVLAVVIVAIVISQQKPSCNKPHILVGTECCLDRNGNNICDEDEETTESQLGQNCQLSPGLNCKSYKADTTGITLLIENPSAKDIIITSIKFTDLPKCALTNRKTITVGDSVRFDIPCTGGLTSGSRFRSDLIITYDETDGLTGLTNTGAVFLNVGIAKSIEEVTEPPIEEYEVLYINDDNDETVYAELPFRLRNCIKTKMIVNTQVEAYTLFIEKTKDSCKLEATGDSEDEKILCYLPLSLVKSVYNMEDIDILFDEHCPTWD